MDAKTALVAAREHPFYLGHSDFVAKTNWKSAATGSGAEDILVDSSGNPVICWAVGTVQVDDFYLSPHCGFDPGRVPAWQVSKGPLRALAESKGSALIGAVPSLASEFNLYKTNLDAIFSAVMPYTDQSGMLVKRGERFFFKINHQMFSLCEGMSPDDIAMTPPERASDGEGNEVLDVELLPAFRMANWPVPESCARLRDAMVKTHKVNPVPAFMSGNKHPIVPTNYVCLLRGAIVHVGFTISHKVLRRKIPISFFTATVDEIIVLQTHAPADLSPSKARFATCFMMNPPEEESTNEGSSGKPGKRRRI
ncbi:hypothetical protein FRC08_003649 [Ceratobasidium sp. 394]|nr:hypothetical protein FRC08_003649 [Ceratobasidium sp. 394]KAG9088112.1 hypothetical protein FS749_002409 [Ceratobasidium sp. UAMH 11750]